MGRRTLLTKGYRELIYKRSSINRRLQHRDLRCARLSYFKEAEVRPLTTPRIGFSTQTSRLLVTLCFEVSASPSPRARTSAAARQTGSCPKDVQRTTFARHVDDTDLFSVNFHFGAPKHVTAAPSPAARPPAPNSFATTYLASPSHSYTPLKPNVLVQHAGEERELRAGELGGDGDEGASLSVCRRRGYTSTVNGRSRRNASGVPNGVIVCAVAGVLCLCRCCCIGFNVESVSVSLPASSSSSKSSATTVSKPQAAPKTTTQAAVTTHLITQPTTMPYTYQRYPYHSYGQVPFVATSLSSSSTTSLPTTSTTSSTAFTSPPQQTPPQHQYQYRSQRSHYPHTDTTPRVGVDDVDERGEGMGWRVRVRVRVRVRSNGMAGGTASNENGKTTEGRNIRPAPSISNTTAAVTSGSSGPTSSDANAKSNGTKSKASIAPAPSHTKQALTPTPTTHPSHAYVPYHAGNYPYAAYRAPVQGKMTTTTNQGQAQKQPV
ncbi:hypothetical protein M422DRAFT_248884 [Sphaerobolus stellatus SS14]|nr:hypothetical protein M422DRAFT_248884 [Sphaerobolus stellatus SS14]